MFQRTDLHKSIFDYWYWGENWWRNGVDNRAYTISFSFISIDFDRSQKKYHNVWMELVGAVRVWRQQRRWILLRSDYFACCFCIFLMYFCRVIMCKKWTIIIYRLAHTDCHVWYLHIRKVHSHLVSFETSTVCRVVRLRSVEYGCHQSNFY